jgi:chemotaxis protein MotA
MDLATIIGLVAGLAAVVSAVILGGESLGTMINPPSLVVVLGGTVGATLITFPLGDILTLRIKLVVRAY